MELKPSTADLEVLNKARSDAEQKRATDTQLERLSGFFHKLVIASNPTRYNMHGERITEWTGITTDDESGTILQTAVVYSYIETGPYQPDITKDIRIRFVDTNDDSLSTKTIDLMQVRTNAYGRPLRLSMSDALGLEACEVDLTGDSEIDPAMVDQVLEIETEILDKIIEATSGSNPDSDN